VDNIDFCELRAMVERLLETARCVYEAVDRNYMVSHLRELIANHYRIGELVDVIKLDRGYVNVSYDIKTSVEGREKRYFLRRYKRGIREEEVKFEHSIVNYLKKRGFKLAAGIIPEKNGKTYVRVVERSGEKEEEVYYAIFEYLKGEDKYTWDNPTCTSRELEDSARVLAYYHNTVYGLKPEGKRYEARIIDLLPTISGNLMKYAKRAGNTKFDNYFLKHLDYILEVIESTIKRIKREDYEKMPRVAIHCDYHPGNLKFENEKVVGMFDFDWSKIDARCFDLALAVIYFCTTWEGKEDGDFLLDRVSIFVNSYQKEAVRGEGVGPLKDIEIHYLAEMIRAANLYVLNWDVDDYYIKKPNPYEYLIYLQHNVRVMRWLESRWDDLVQVLKKILEEVPVS